MTALIIHPPHQPLVGSVPVPSDKSIGHRALLFSSLCTGISEIRGFSHGEDNVSTANAMRAMGVQIDERPGEISVRGVGLFGLREPKAALDCGNSGTTMRLLAGILGAQPFKSVLVGDESLSKRPMMRVVGPLRTRGARIDGKKHPKKDDITAPLEIGPLAEDEFLKELEFESAIASAQVKSAILLSGLYAHGVTLFREPMLSRDHTERMLRALGAPLETMGAFVKLDPAGWDGKLPAFEITIPGDISAAAFLLVAAQLVPGSRVTARGVGVNPTRTGILEILRDMGAGLGIESLGDRGGEPVADLHAETMPLRAIRTGGEVVTRAIDEVPIACALAARAAGTTEISGAEELRVKESDRLATMAGVLKAFGVRVQERPDGLVIEGTHSPLETVDIDSQQDHRIAMTTAVMALVAKGPCRVRNADCIATSYPKFVGTLRALGVRVDVEKTD